MASGEGRGLIPGSQVVSKSRGQGGVVTRVLGSGANLSYQVAFFNGETAVVPGWDIEQQLSLVDRLVAGDFDDPVDYDLRNWALRLRIAHSQDPYASLSSSRLEPQPHQVFVTHKAVRNMFPRLILADEVGLGKTIEAGMILKELKARGLVKRALIVAPASLVYQWQREMDKKFNERFTVYDSSREHVLKQDYPGSNIFKVHDEVVCSVNFARDEKRLDAIVEAGWDLVIFDEAHHVRRVMESGSEVRSTKLYTLAERLRDRSRSLLLLTATPLQLHLFEFYSLVELIDPTLFDGFTDFRNYKDLRTARNQAIGQIGEYTSLSPSSQSRVAAEVAAVLTDCGLPTSADVVHYALASDAGRNDVIKAITDADRLGQIMIRNRKRIIGGFTQRKATTIAIEPTVDEQEVYESMREFIRQGYKRSEIDGDKTLGFVMVVFQKLLASSRHALMQALRRRIEKLEPGSAKAPARLFNDTPDEEDPDEPDFELSDQFENYADYGHTTEEARAIQALLNKVAALPRDTKAEKLVELMQGIVKQQDDKVLIFTQFIGTMEHLKKVLSKRYSVVVFHGGMDAVEKDRAVQQFKQSVQVMIATEAGSEGRNFQFCSMMVNYDLPWNPVRLEQRIGRLDRIGQLKDVRVYNFVTAGTIEEQVHRVLADRIRIFEEAIGGLDPILGDLEHDLTKLIMSGASDQEVHRFEVSLERRLAEAREAEEKMADFLMDTASFRKDTYNTIQGRTPSYAAKDIEAFLELYYSRYPSGSFKRNADGVIEVEPAPAWREKHPQLDGSTKFVGTCDAALAVREENLNFFAFGNPYFEAAIEDYSGQNVTGRVTSRICYGTREPGRRLLECQVLYEFKGIRTFKRLMPLIFSLDDGTFEPNAEELSRWRSDGMMGPRFATGEEEAIHTAWQDIEVQIDHLQASLQAEYEDENERLYNVEADRLGRLFSYKKAKAEMDQHDAVERLERLSASTRDDDKRVLPIFRARVRDLEQEIEAIEHERQQRLAELELGRRLVPSYNIESAALVMTQ